MMRHRRVVGWGNSIMRVLRRFLEDWTRGTRVLKRPSMLREVSMVVMVMGRSVIMLLGLALVS